MFDIAVDQVTGCAWFATEHGVTRFDGSRWESFSVLAGLPAGGISSLAIDGNRQLWAAGACGGLYHFDGNSWQQSEHDAGLANVPVNDLLFARDGTLWVASTQGVYSRSAAVESESARGRKLLGKVLGRRQRRTAWTHYTPSQVLPRRAREDHVTCLAENGDGTLCLGTRKSGVLVFNPAKSSWSLLGKAHGLADTYVSAILPLTEGVRIVGTYGYGLSILGRDAGTMLPRSTAQAGASAARTELSGVPIGTPASERSRHVNEGVQREARLALAVPCRSSAERRQVGGHGGEETPFSLTSVDATIAALERAPRERSPVVHIGQDWQTQGDWIGNYGTFAYVLPAMGAPHDFKGGRGLTFVKYRAYMGESRKPGDSLRYWTHFKRTQDRKCLQNPTEHSRRQSSWDDAGEIYPPTHDGPHVFIDLTLPPSDFLVSLYFVNIDCLECPAGWRTSDRFPLPNRFRDYLIQVKEKAESEDEFNRGKLLASTRVRDFAGGVYERFYVKGGNGYTIKVARCGSHNTVIAGLFVEAPPNTLYWPDAALHARALTLSELPAAPELRAASRTLHQSMRRLSASLETLRKRSMAAYCRALPSVAVSAATASMSLASEYLNTQSWTPEVTLDDLVWSADLLKAAGFTASAMRVMDTVGELHTQRIKLAQDERETARSAFWSAFESRWQRVYSPEVAGHISKGWQPFEHDLCLARAYAASLGEADLAALKTLVTGFAGNHQMSPVGAVLWQRVTQLEGDATLTAVELRAKAWHHITAGDPKRAAALLKKAASDASDKRVKASCLELLAETATLFLKDAKTASSASKQAAQLREEIAAEAKARPTARELFRQRPQQAKAEGQPR